MMTKHIMDKRDIFDFGIAMLDELEKHKAEKEGLRSWHIDSVRQLAINETEQRLFKIDDSDDKKEMQKQCIHIANYLFFLWCKAREK